MLISRDVQALGRRLLLASLLTACMVGWPLGAAAQVTFGVDITDEVRETIGEEKEITAESLYDVFSDGLRTRYEGEEPITARFLIFFINADGDLQGVTTGTSFDLVPGRTSRGEMASRDEFLRLFEETGVIGGYPSIPAAPLVMDIDSSSPVIYQFEDDWMDREDRDRSEAWPPKWSYIWAQTLMAGVELDGESGAIGIAVVPAIAPFFLDVIGRYIDPETETIDPEAEIKVRYITVMNRTNR